MSDAIVISGLTKSFGQTRALDGVDLTVRSGEVHGFLGPNGAGKSTTIRILLGLLRADGGTATLLGSDPWRDAATLHRRLAYVPGEVTLWPNLTGGEVIDLLGQLRGGLDPKRRTRLLERFDLDPTKKGRTYSKGNRQKVALVAALSSDVELLLLDEPTAGLDPAHARSVFAMLRAHCDRGNAAVVVTHDLDLALRHGGAMWLIADGRLAGSGAPAAVLASAATNAAFGVAIHLGKLPSGEPFAVPA
jgi:polyether ionophore transport system ATP-binding protein